MYYFDRQQSYWYNYTDLGLQLGFEQTQTPIRSRRCNESADFLYEFFSDRLSIAEDR